jgi:hypothetical protein
VEKVGLDSGLLEWIQEEIVSGCLLAFDNNCCKSCCLDFQTVVVPVLNWHVFSIVFCVRVGDIVAKYRLVAFRIYFSLSGTSASKSTTPRSSLSTDTAWIRETKSARLLSTSYRRCLLPAAQRPRWSQCARSFGCSKLYVSLSTRWRHFVLPFL